MKKSCLMTTTLVISLLLASIAFAGVDPGARDSVWFQPDGFTWNGDTAFVTAFYATTDTELKQATIVLSWNSTEIKIDSVSLVGSRWEAFVNPDSGAFVATEGLVGGVPSGTHYNISFLPFHSLLAVGSGQIGSIFWSKAVTPVTISTITVDSSTTTSGVAVQNSTLFGTSGLPDDNFTPAFSGFSASVVSCSCPYQGDFNADAAIDAIDLGNEIDAIFFSGANPQDPLCSIQRGDFNCDGFTDAVDLGGIIDHIFFGGGPPCNPCP